MVSWNRASIVLRSRPSRIDPGLRVELAAQAPHPRLTIHPGTQARRPPLTLQPIDAVIDRDAAHLATHQPGELIPGHLRRRGSQHLTTFGQSFSLVGVQLAQGPSDHIDMTGRRLAALQHTAKFGDRCGGRGPIEPLRRLGHRHPAGISDHPFGENRRRRLGQLRQTSSSGNLHRIQPATHPTHIPQHHRHRIGIATAQSTPAIDSTNPQTDTTHPRSTTRTLEPGGGSRCSPP